MNGTSEENASVLGESVPVTPTDAISTLHAANRALKDRVAALEVVIDHTNDMECKLMRARGTAHLHGLQPSGVTPSARELAWDMVRTFWMTGTLPPPSAFDLWVRMPINDWAQVESAANDVLRLSYATYKKTSRPSAQLDAFMRNAFGLRFYVLAALRGAPEGYLSSIFAEITAAAAEVDVPAARERITATARTLELTMAQRNGLWDAWTTFQGTMAAVARDVAMLEGVLAHVLAHAAVPEGNGSVGRDFEDVLSRPAASTKATDFLSAATAARALALCNERRLAAYLALAWAVHKQLLWWQYMEMYNASDKCPFDYVHVMQLLLSEGADGADGGQGAGAEPAMSAASAAGGDSSCTSD